MTHNTLSLFLLLFLYIFLMFEKYAEKICLNLNFIIISNSFLRNIIRILLNQKRNKKQWIKIDYPKN